MAEESKPVQSAKKPERKMVPESDLIAIKSARDKLKEELAEAKGALKTTESELKIAKMDTGDEEEVSKVKQYLLNLSGEVEEKQTKLKEDLTSFKEREREVGAKELVADLRQKGVEVDIETLLNEEDMTSKSKDLLVEHLVKEKEELAEKAPGSVYESSPGGVAKTQPKDMSNEDFTAHVKREREEALSKK